MNGAFVLFNPLTGDAIKAVNSVGDVIDFLGVKTEADEIGRLTVSISSALADMMCGHLVACDLYDYRNGFRPVGLVTPRMDAASYVTPLNSLTLGIYPDSIKSFYRPPSEAAVRLTMALVEAEDALKH